MEKTTRKEFPNGTIEYRNSRGELHREDGPAIEGRNGNKEWYLNGKLHREDGPAIEWSKGDKAWYLNGKLHREDGPAIETTTGSKFWYSYDKRHREDGPAIEHPNGSKTWYLNGQELTEEEFNKRMNTNKRNYTVSKTFDQDFTYESKLITTINEFKQHLKTNK